LWGTYSSLDDVFSAVANLGSGSSEVFDLGSPRVCDAEKAWPGKGPPYTKCGPGCGSFMIFRLADEFVTY